jgi:acyl dehydratase
MSDQTYFEDVSVGDPIPVLTLVVDETQMFFYSAATYNGHRIHYDKAWATEVEGYPNTLVHGPLQAALLARAVSFSFQNRASAFAGDELSFAGAVTGKHDDGDRSLVDLEIREEKDGGQVLVPGTATVSLPRRR